MTAKNNKKVTDLLNEIILTVGPVHFFIWKGLTSTSNLTKYQQQVLFSYIQKVNSRVWFNPIDLRYEGQPNLYRWIDRRFIEGRWNELREEFSQKKYHRPRFTQYDLKTELVTSQSNFEDAIEISNPVDLNIIRSLWFEKRGKKQVLIKSFYQRKSGRKWTGIQNMTKVVKRKMFSGYYDIDMNSCLPTIFYHLSESKPRPLLNYIEEKESLRAYFQGILNVNKDIAKSILASLLFGVRNKPGTVEWDLKYNTGNYKTYFTKLFLKTPDKARRLVNDPVFRELADAFEEVSLELTRKAKKQAIKKDNHWYFTNVYGDTLIIEPPQKWIPMDWEDGWVAKEGNVRWNTRRVAAHIFFGYESLIIESLGLNPRKHILYHDGFITSEELDVSELEEKVLDATGIPMTFSQEEL